MINFKLKMNRFSASLFFLICFTFPSFSQFKLEVEITGIRNNKGNLMLELLDSKEIAIKQEMSPITDNKCSFTFSDLASGQYAIRYYHDENQLKAMGFQIMLSGRRDLRRLRSGYLRLAVIRR
jgi:uncharacterized protein (DUF2141 family)